MNHFLLDASALIKRFAAEIGSPLVNDLFTSAAQQPRLLCLMLGVAETVAALVRKRNAGKILPSDLALAMLQLQSDVINQPGFLKLETTNIAIARSLPLLERHSINASDGIVLRTALDEAATLRSGGQDLVLVAADQRLIRAGTAEGLRIFDPETQSQTDLTALL